MDAFRWRERVVFHEGDAAYTFAEVFEGSNTVAANLVDAGVRGGDRLLMALPDSWEFVVTFLGALRIGAVPIPMNPEIHADERAQLVARSSARLVVSSVAMPGQACVDPTALLAPRSRGAAATGIAHRTHDEIAYGVFSSGTTGLPKIIFHSHGDPVVFTSAFASHLGIGPGDTSVSAARMCFAAGLGNSFFFPLLRGSAAVLSRPRLTPERAASLIGKHAATMLYGPPSFYGHILADGFGDRLCALRLAACGGAVLPLVLEQRLRAYLDDRLVNIFGSSEIGHAMVVNGPGYQQEGASGRVLPPYDARVVDDAGSVAPPGVEGKLQVSGTTITLGVERADASPVRFGATEWYGTGDAATIDAEGFVRISGRLDDLEIVGAQNVHPAEIESVLLGLDEIRNAVVYSSVQPDGQPLLKALIVPADRRADEGDLLGLVQAHVGKHLSWYKVPQIVELTDEIPLTAFGKIDRKAIRKRAHQASLKTA
ncbi:hypothetical protein BZL54_04115 [Burkholderia ubonensis subsp. mesacidophila]|uniref:Uncharacterized protein n=1 Tax=Burkholderia ubonensis subsp. mesacidophila TaxID=265293 RepID=A0A2A4FKW7_9BURK|nr:hypothetical protein BZL54_04115 [Burkholderia ubonensis subsp. mesacidophila]